MADIRIPRGDLEYVKSKLAGSEEFISVDVSFLRLQAFSAFLKRLPVSELVGDRLLF